MRGASDTDPDQIIFEPSYHLQWLLGDDVEVVFEPEGTSSETTEASDAPSRRSPVPGGHGHAGAATADGEADQD